MILKFKEGRIGNMEKILKVGRPKLNIDKNLLLAEIEKYKNGQQKAIDTYRNLNIGKTSFYRILSNMEVKRQWTMKKSKN